MGSTWVCCQYKDWKHWLSCKEKFHWCSKEGHADRLLGHEKNHYNWFPWKKSNSASYYQLVVKLATIVKGDLKALFSIATTPRCRGGHYYIPELFQFTLDPYLIMLSFKQGGIKYHFLSLWSSGPLANSSSQWPNNSNYLGKIPLFYRMTLVFVNIKYSTWLLRKETFWSWYSKLFFMLCIVGSSCSIVVIY